MRPIDADAFVSVLQLVADSLRGGDCGEWARGYVDGLDAVHRTLLGVDTITIDDLRPNGEWIVAGGFFCCNHCGCSPADWESDSKNESGLPPYCHSCGRKMKGGGK